MERVSSGPGSSQTGSCLGPWIVVGTGALAFFALMGMLVSDFVSLLAVQISPSATRTAPALQWSYYRAASVRKTRHLLAAMGADAGDASSHLHGAHSVTKSYARSTQPKASTACLSFGAVALSVAAGTFYRWMTSKTERNLPIQIDYRRMLRSAAGAAMAMGSVVAPLALDTLVLCPLNPPPAAAEEKRQLASISGSGFIFKDKLRVEAFADPRLPGVTVYISDFERPINERLQGDFFTDPSTAGLACAGQQAVEPTSPLPAVEEVFTEAKSLFAKTIRVDRVYDKETKTAIYVAYNTRVDKNSDSNKSRFKSAMCAVPLQPLPTSSRKADAPRATADIPKAADEGTSSTSALDSTKDSSDPAVSSTTASVAAENVAAVPASVVKPVR